MKLFEILSIERTKVTAFNKLYDETMAKFKKDSYFTGYLKTLNMLKDSPENKAIEEAATEVKALPTTVAETLSYLFKFWVEAEDVLYVKNVSNQHANSDIVYRGTTIASNVPVDELMGLETRLENLRKLFDNMPTLDASKKWDVIDSGRDGEYQTSVVEVTSKTDKIVTPIVLYPATDKHPAQIDKVTKDEVVGTFRRIVYSGAATSKHKANLLAATDELIAEVKKARMRANAVEASKERIGEALINALLKSIED